MGISFGQVVGGLLTMSGAGQVAGSQSDQGKQARKRGYEQKTFNEIAAGQMIAIGQRAAMEEDRQAEIMASRAVAVAAAGGSVLDVTHLIADIYGEGAYRASIAMHDAKNAADRLLFEGKQAAEYGEGLYKAKQREAKGTRLAAIGSIIGQASSNYG